MKWRTLVVLTSSFPFDFAKESTFILPELKILSTEFDQVLIVPFFHDSVDHEIAPENIFTISNYSRAPFSKKFRVEILFRAIVQKSFWSELTSRPRSWWTKNRLAELVNMMGQASLAGEVIQKLIITKQLDLKSTLFYTYWFDVQTTALARLKEKLPDISFITRAHGSDIYDERTALGYKPLRPYVLDRIQRVFVASEDGCRYLHKRFPQFSDKITFRHLGIEWNGKLNQRSSDGILRVVSVSYIHPVKRLDLLFRCLNYFAEHSEQTIEWTHIGGGDMLGELKSRCEAQRVSKLALHFLGNLKNTDLINFYDTNLVDFFITVSESEGGAPVSVMEALSKGIPVIGTSVGGIPEIVDSTVGALLPKNITPAEFSATLRLLVVNNQRIDSMRQRANEKFQTHFNAQQNHRLFVQELKALSAIEA